MMRVNLKRPQFVKVWKLDEETQEMVAYPIGRHC